MNIKFFDSHKFDRRAFELANQQFSLVIDYLEPSLNAQTASLASGATVVCSFVNDQIDRQCVETLAKVGVQLIALRCAGFNHVDLKAADDYNILVCRVPAYSPHAIAEFTVGLVLSLSRKIHHSYLRVKELNFSLDGLEGFNLHGKTVGVIGAGKIGKIFATIMAAMGCRVLVNDTEVDRELSLVHGINYTDIYTLCKDSDIISLHVPLTPITHHLIDHEKLQLMKNGVVLINTGRGGLIDTSALINGLKSGKIGGAALDVYEEEENIFFHDLSDTILQDDQLARLLTFPNVLVTSHQAFLTKEALHSIASTTLESITHFIKNRSLPMERRVTAKQQQKK